jgi:hypothetical protein
MIDEDSPEAGLFHTFSGSPYAEAAMLQSDGSLRLPDREEAPFPPLFSYPEAADLPEGVSLPGLAVFPDAHGQGGIGGKAIMGPEQDPGLRRSVWEIYKDAPPVMERLKALADSLGPLQESRDYTAITAAELLELIDVYEGIRGAVTDATIIKSLVGYVGGVEDRHLSLSGLTDAEIEQLPKDIYAAYMVLWDGSEPFRAGIRQMDPARLQTMIDSTPALWKYQAWFGSINAGLRFKGTAQPLDTEAAAQMKGFVDSTLKRLGAETPFAAWQNFTKEMLTLMRTANGRPWMSTAGWAWSCRRTGINAREPSRASASFIKITPLTLPRSIRPRCVREFCRTPPRVSRT